MTGNVVLEFRQISFEEKLSGFGCFRFAGEQHQVNPAIL
jgi:hypothetical protein